MVEKYDLRRMLDELKHDTLGERRGDRQILTQAEIRLLVQERRKGKQARGRE